MSHWEEEIGRNVSTCVCSWQRCAAESRPPRGGAPRAAPGDPSRNCSRVFADVRDELMGSPGGRGPGRVLLPCVSVCKLHVWPGPAPEDLGPEEWEERGLAQRPLPPACSASLWLSSGEVASRPWAPAPEVASRLFPQKGDGLRASESLRG